MSTVARGSVIVFHRLFSRCRVKVFVWSGSFTKAECHTGTSLSVELTLEVMQVHNRHQAIATNEVEVWRDREIRK